MDARNLNPATVYPFALAAMRNSEFLKTPKYQEQQTRALKEGADPLILEFSEKLIKRMAALGVPMFAHCIVRPYHQQAVEFAQGDSLINPAKTPWPHRAYAVDIIHSVHGWMDKFDHKPTGVRAWEIVGHVGKEVANSMDIDIKWGGEFKRLYDPAHFELADWRERYSARFDQ